MVGLEARTLHLWRCFFFLRRIGSGLRAAQRVGAVRHYRLRAAACNRGEHGLDNYL